MVIPFIDGETYKKVDSDTEDTHHTYDEEHLNKYTFLEKHKKSEQRQSRKKELKKESYDM